MSRSGIVSFLSCSFFATFAFGRVRSYASFIAKLDEPNNDFVASEFHTNVGAMYTVCKHISYGLCTGVMAV